MITYKNHIEKLRLIKEGKLSLVENVREFLLRIDDRKNLNAFNSIFGEEALQRAKEIEHKIADGSYGKLAGMVIAIKDVLAIKDKPLTCSSKILENLK